MVRVQCHLALIDRLARGEAVPGGPGACDRNGCAHLTLWHGEHGRYRGRPCRQCDCPAYLPQPEGAAILGQLHTVNASPAAVYRAIGTGTPPTLLVDDANSI